MSVIGTGSDKGVDMSLGLVLIILGVVLAFLDIVLYHTVTAYNRVLLTSVGVVLIGVALLISSGSIHA